MAVPCSDTFPTEPALPVSPSSSHAPSPVLSGTFHACGSLHAVIDQVLTSAFASLIRTWHPGEHQAPTQCPVSFCRADGSPHPSSRHVLEASLLPGSLARGFRAGAVEPGSLHVGPAPGLLLSHLRQAASPFGTSASLSVKLGR